MKLIVSIKLTCRAVYALSTRPFLVDAEKLYITYQLLTLLRDLHKLKVGKFKCLTVQSLQICHGDIKSENILLTTWGGIYLSDFAPYKPTYLPIDNPADFAYFFKSSPRQVCNIAPERFRNKSDLMRVRPFTIDALHQY